MIKRSLFGILCVLALAAGFLAVDGYYSHVEAQSAAETRAELDAGVTTPGPSVEIGDTATVVAETHLDGDGPVVAPPVVVVHSPAPPEISVDNSTETLAQDGRWAALAVALTIGLRQLSKRIKTSSALAFLRRGRWPALVGGTVAIASAIGDVLVAGGTWTAVGLAAIAASVAYVDGFGADEDKPKTDAVTA